MGGPAALVGVSTTGNMGSRPFDAHGQLLCSQGAPSAIEGLCDSRRREERGTTERPLPVVRLTRGPTNDQGAPCALCLNLRNPPVRSPIFTFFLRI
jgi:hypothetical protein